MSQSLPSIALLDDYHDRAHAFADWQSHAFASFHFYNEPFANEDALVNAIQHHHAVGLMRERTPFPASVIERLPQLELIVTSGKKNASIDVEAATARGITVCGTESPGHATAELAFLMTMTLIRKLIPLVNELENNNNWQSVMGQDIRGKTLGILGLGRLGEQLAGFASSMGMHVIAWSENLSQERCQKLGVEYVNRQQLFQRADVVSIHLRHSQRTHHLVNSDDLVRLGASGYIVNTSRAEIIDLDALKTALNTGQIAGAGIDVFEKEPTPEKHWLVSHPRVLATPHVGYCTEETFKVFYSQMLEAFQGYYNGNPIRVIGKPE